MGLYKAIKNSVKAFKRSFNEPNYDAEGVKGRNRSWTTGITSPNSMLEGGIPTIRNRSRDLTRKFALMNGAYDTISSNIVGTAIKAMSKAMDKAQRDYIKEVWEDWCEECDIDGINDFSACLDIMVRERYEAGEIFVRFIPIDPNEESVVPLRIQVLEAEYVPFDMNEDLQNGNKIRGGIEFDKKGKRVAYYMYENHPGDAFGFNNSYLAKRIPASEVMHYFKQLRAGQVRGIPEAYASLTKARDLMIYEEAELIKKQTSSMLMGFITKPAVNEDGNAINGDINDPDADIGQAVAKMSPGTMMELAEGEDIKFSSPTESGSSFEPYMKLITRELGLSINMTYEEFTGDLSGVNFSSIRAGLNQSQRKYKKEQHRLIHMVCLPIWRRFFETAFLSGKFNFKNYLENKREYDRVQFQAPGWAYVNPLQEVQAKKEQIRAGLKSRSQIVAENGDNIEEVDELLKQDKERAKEFGLVFDTDSGISKNIKIEDLDKIDIDEKKK